MRRILLVIMQIICYISETLIAIQTLQEKLLYAVNEKCDIHIQGAKGGLTDVILSQKPTFCIFASWVTNSGYSFALQFYNWTSSIFLAAYHKAITNGHTNGPT